MASNRSMAWSLPSRRSSLILSVGALACLFYGPLSAWTDASILVMSGTEVLWSTVRPEPAAAHPLKTAIHNVTYDFDELCNVVVDFLHSPGVDAGVEDAFREYLARRASRAHPRLESCLDWLLGLYKLVFPFLILSIASKVFRHSEAPPPPLSSDGSQSVAGVAPTEESLAHSRMLLRKAGSMAQTSQVPSSPPIAARNIMRRP